MIIPRWWFLFCAMVLIFAIGTSAGYCYAHLHPKPDLTCERELAQANAAVMNTDPLLIGLETQKATLTADLAKARGELASAGGFQCFTSPQPPPGPGKAKP